MRIAVSIAVIEFLHQLGGSVAQMERNGQIARLLDKVEGIVDGAIGRVGFGRRGEINRGFGQRNAPLRPTDFLHGIKGGIGQE